MFSGDTVKKNELGGPCRLYVVWGRGEVDWRFWCRNIREREYLEDVSIDGRIILKCMLKTWVGEWTGLIWLRTGTDGGLLCMWEWIFGFHIMWGISLRSEDMLDAQERLFRMDIYIYIYIYIYQYTVFIVSSDCYCRL